jgi:hypothetical protein
MCEVFFFGTARRTESQRSDRSGGTVMEMEGKAIAAERKPNRGS